MRKNGFTLIELMVVVAIIILLIGILIPALGGVKNKARVASTTALMSNLQADIDSYYQTFSAYPGPVGLDGTTIASGKISGAQNLLMGLSYAIASPGTGTVLPPSGLFRVDPSKPTGPINYAATNAITGQPQQLAPFFSPSGSQLSKSIGGGLAWPPAGMAGATPANDRPFPVIVDTFNDALPILYYRRAPGVDRVTPVPGQPLAYSRLENAEYTDATAQLVSSSGTVCPQSPADDPRVFDDNTLVNYIKNPTSPSARGGYFLLSAGIDRKYGLKATPPSGVPPVDDNIPLVGGN